MSNSVVDYVPLIVFVSFLSGFVVSNWWANHLKRLEKKWDDDVNRYLAGLPSGCDRYAAISRQLGQHIPGRAARKCDSSIVEYRGG